MPYNGEYVLIRVGGVWFLAEYDRHDPVKWGDAPHVAWTLHGDTGKRGQKYAVRPDQLVRLGCCSSPPLGGLRLGGLR